MCVNVSRGALVSVVLLAAWPFVPLIADAHAAADCQTEATSLAKDQAELPRLEVASPADRPITCITLETIMAFASRIKAHVAHCPASSYTPFATQWETTRLDYVKRFAQNRCKRTF
jgi:hypothetical protein